MPQNVFKGTNMFLEYKMVQDIFFLSHKCRIYCKDHQHILGTERLTDEIEEVLAGVRTGRVPSIWRARSYPTLKGLGSYITDLVQRLQFLQVR